MYAQRNIGIPFQSEEHHFADVAEGENFATPEPEDQSSGATGEEEGCDSGVDDGSFVVDLTDDRHLQPYVGVIKRFSLKNGWGLITNVKHGDGACNAGRDAGLDRDVRFYEADRVAVGLEVGDAVEFGVIQDAAAPGWSRAVDLSIYTGPLLDIVLKLPEPPAPKQQPQPQAAPRTLAGPPPYSAVPAGRMADIGVFRPQVVMPGLFSGAPPLPANPPQQRPTTTSIVARRLVHSHLDLKLSAEHRAAERAFWGKPAKTSCVEQDRREDSRDSIGDSNRCWEVPVPDDDDDGLNEPTVTSAEVTAGEQFGAEVSAVPGAAGGHAAWSDLGAKGLRPHAVDARADNADVSNPVNEDSKCSGRVLAIRGNGEVISVKNSNGEVRVAEGSVACRRDKPATRVPGRLFASALKHVAAKEPSPSVEEEASSAFRGGSAADSGEPEVASKDWRWGPTQVEQSTNPVDGALGCHEHGRQQSQHHSAGGAPMLHVGGASKTGPLGNPRLFSSALRGVVPTADARKTEAEEPADAGSAGEASASLGVRDIEGPEENKDADQPDLWQNWKKSSWSHDEVQVQAWRDATRRDDWQNHNAPWSQQSWPSQNTDDATISTSYYGAGARHAVTAEVLAHTSSADSAQQGRQEGDEAQHPRRTKPTNKISENHKSRLFSSALQGAMGRSTTQAARSGSEA